MQNITPDYKNLSLRDGLLVEEFAFLIYEINPKLYVDAKQYDMSLDFNFNDVGLPRLIIPFSLEEMLDKQKIILIKNAYIILETVNWKEKYKGHVDKSSRLIHPYLLVQEAQLKGLPIPEDFINFIDDRRCKENEIELLKGNGKSSKRSQAHISRAENNKNALIAAMAYDGYNNPLRKLDSLPEILEKVTDELGHRVGKDTIRKMLNEASSFIPDKFAGELSNKKS